MYRKLQQFMFQKVKGLRNSEKFEQNNVNETLQHVVRTHYPQPQPIEPQPNKNIENIY